MRSPWERPFAIEEDARTPLYARIARAITEDVRRGRLRPGDPMPSSRALAATLGRPRKTIVAAYRALVDEGWLETRPRGGTFVALALPDAPPRRFASRRALRSGLPERPGFPVRPSRSTMPVPPRDGLIVLSGGIPDLGRVPSVAMARAYRRALSSRGHRLLGYGDPRGEPTLREALATMLSATRGLAARAENVLVTRGSQMALRLVAEAVLAPGDAVAVEHPGYRSAWEAFEAASARIVPIPVDDEGLRVDALESAMARERIRAVYVTPHHQYPTTVGLSAARRIALLRLVEKHGIALVEDDYDHEFHYEGRPLLPLASADPAGHVVYVGTLSKTLAPSLRVGYVVAPSALVESLAARRYVLDRQGDAAVEHAIADLIEDGTLARHVRAMRRVYRERRDAFARALRTELGDAITFDLPRGGLSLWVTLCEGDTDAWELAARERGVWFMAGSHFVTTRGASRSARLGYAPVDEATLVQAARILAATVPGRRRAGRR